MKMKALPLYYEELDDIATNPSSEYYYGEEILSALPRLSDHINKLPRKEKKIILNYLQSHEEIDSGFWETCVYDGCELLSVTYSDGTYIWDESHIHFVANYSLDLPQEFKHHVFNSTGKLSDAQKKNIDEYVRFDVFEALEKTEEENLKILRDTILFGKVKYE